MEVIIQTEKELEPGQKNRTEQYGQDLVIFFLQEIVVKKEQMLYDIESMLAIDNQ